MLKKVLFVMLALLIATSCFAQLQSGPSNKVGYVKITCGAGGTGSAAVSTPFGLPFKFWTVTGNIPQYGLPATNDGNTKPSSIIGDQLPHYINVLHAEKIVRQGGGTGGGDIGWENLSGVWQSNLENNSTMEPGRAYFYVNKHAANTLVLAGEVANTPIDSSVFINAPATPGSAFTALSWRNSRSDAVNTLNLIGTPGTRMIGGLTSTASDRLVEQGTGTIGWINLANVWSATGLQFITPGRAYWIINKHVGHSWSYRWMNTGTNFSVDAGDKAVNTPKAGHGIQKVTAPVTVKKTVAEVKSNR